MKKILIAVGVGLVVGIGASTFYMSRGTNDAQNVSQTPTGPTYVALGDSVAAGIGLPNSSDSSACDRTEESYPKLVAKALSARLTSVACSGATIRGGIDGSQTINKLSLKPQIQSLAKQNPSRVSLTIGANDSSWLELVIKCYQSVCGDAADEQLYEQRLTDLRAQLRSKVQKISDSVGGSSRIVVTGYYHVFPVTDFRCSDLEGVDDTELAFGRTLQAKLNDAIKEAVTDVDKVTYAPADFSGHELCSADPWVQGLADSAPYHPTAAGQEKIADQVISAFKKENR